MKQRLFNILVMALLTALILAGSPTIVFSSDKTIGKVVALRGKAVAIQSDSNSRSLALKSPVFLKDTIKTTQGRIQLMFKDNTLITLGRNTEMILKEYHWESGDPNSSIKTKIKAGSFRVMGGAITRDAPQNFITEAPAATIGIRGSMYAGLVKGKSLIVVFQGGKGIYVANSKGSVDIDRPGYGTTVKDAAQAPEKPEKMDETALQEMEGELATNAEETEGETDQETDSENQIADSEMGAPEEIHESTGTENTIDEIKITVDQDTPNITPPPTISEDEKNILAMLKDMGFTGDRATAVPATGLWTYTGKLTDSEDETIQDDMNLFVNWDNKRILAVDDDPYHPSNTTHGFGFGQVTDTGEIVNVHVLGTDNYNDTQIETMTGSETFGHIYGTSQEAAGMVIEGYDINIQDQTTQRTWSDTMAVLVDTKVANPNSGIATWNGFFTGVGEDMSNPDTDRVAFNNSDSSDFEILINKDNGIFSGTLSGGDFLGSSNQIDLLTLGGDQNKSVYISDDKIAAVLGGTNVISNSSGSTSLKSHGNFMVSSMETQLSDNTNWGYWEIAYKEPGTGKDYHVHVPGAFWIAGGQTPASVVNNIITDAASTPFSATYTGDALGVKFDNSNQMSILTNGQTNLIIDFYSGTTLPVTGTISFDEISLPVTSSMGDVTSHGFSGTITPASVSRVSGTFFGNTITSGVQGAQGIGGNFSATISTTTYQGVFAGDR